MNKKKYNTISSEKARFLMYLPLIIAASIIPLIVRIYLVDFPVEKLLWLKDDATVLDLYSYGKSKIIIFSGFVSLIILTFKFYNEKIKLFKDPIIIISLVSMFILILSSLFSDYSQIVYTGYLERYEGLFVNLSYWLLFILAYKLPWDKESLIRFFKWFAFSNLVLSFIGLGQYFGFDILLSNYVIPLITSFELSNMKLDATSMTNYKVIGQTLYHYNYVSFFITMSFPFTISSALYSKDKRNRIFYILLSILILFNLLGSSARSGLAGLIIGLPLWIIFNRHKLFKNVKIFSIVIVSVVLLFIGFETISGGFVTMRLKSTFNTSKSVNQIQRVYTAENNIKVELIDHILSIETIPSSFDLMSFKYKFDGEPINTLLIGDSVNMRFNHDTLSKIALKLQYSEKDEILYSLTTDKVTWHFLYKDNELVLYNIYGNYENIENFESIGFEGYEKFGSARGYIWSRTLPLILDKPFLGYGPDTFPLIFPQQDYIGKYYAYNTANMIVDKAHNLPIQQAVSFGIPYLILFISLIILFYIKAIKKLHSNKYLFNNLYQSIFFTLMTSYLVASLFNDSSVHVSPVFWTLFGIGMSIYSKDDQSILS